MLKLLTIAKAMFKYGFGVVILLLLGVYLWCAFFAQELSVAKYQDEFLAATLFWLVGLALLHAAGLSANQRALENAGRSLSALAEAAAGPAAEVRFHEGDAVYEATQEAIHAARERVWVTYLRGESPHHRDSAERHFQACRDWAMRSTRHSFRRIILHSDRPEMADFYDSELRNVLAARTGKHSYLVKLLHGSVHSTEAFSVGIYDDLVFFSHNDGPDRTIAISIRSAKLAEGYLKDYYNRLWNLDAARPITEVRPAADVLSPADAPG